MNSVPLIQFSHPNCSDNDLYSLEDEINFVLEAQHMAYDSQGSIYALL